MLSAEQVIAAIHGSYAKGSKNGFHNMHRLLDALHTVPGCGLLSQRDGVAIPVIHVAGTNGKGSICATLESILRHAGYHTGLYTSPFLQAYQERIRLDGQPVSDELLVKYGNPLVNIAQQMEADGDCPTPFELGTALALSTFQGEKVDIAIIEVGLGGRKDPTNVVKPAVCAIAAIGLDHTQFLGDTIEAIAREKAGIIKPGVPVVCHPAEPSVAEVFACAAADAGAPLTQLHVNQIRRADCRVDGSTAEYVLADETISLTIHLPGEHQLTNTLTALGVVDALRREGMTIPHCAVQNGVAATVWPARLEWSGNILIDGAHNAQGVEALRRFVKLHLPDKRRVLLSGVLSEKLQPAILAALAEIADVAVTVTPDTPRAMDASEYAAHLRTAGVDAHPASTIEEGLARARKLAGEDAVIIASGSLYFAGALRSVLGLGWR